MACTTDNHCLIFSHRGASLEAAENTPDAFDKALAYAVDGIETDVQLTRDGIAILWHDRFLDKIGKPGQRIDDFDFVDICGFVLPESFAHGETNTRLISLEAFIHTYHHCAQLLIEVKNRPWDRGTGRHEQKMRRCMDFAEKQKGIEGTHGISISSFDFESLAYAHKYYGECPLIYNSEDLVQPAHIGKFFKKLAFISGLCLPIENLNEANVGTLINLNKTIATYTCNENEQILKGLRLGVDILITDDPQRAISLRADEP